MRLRLDVSTGKKIKNANILRLKNTVLNNQKITEEIKKEIKICIEMNENENPKPMGFRDRKSVVYERV